MEDYKPTYRLININNPVFSTFMLWSSILIIKFISLTLLTVFQRFRTHVSMQYIRS